jgi:hypothetical protein
MLDECDSSCQVRWMGFKLSGYMNVIQVVMLYECDSSYHVRWMWFKLSC